MKQRFERSFCQTSCMLPFLAPIFVVRSFEGGNTEPHGTFYSKVCVCVCLRHAAFPKVS